MRLVLHGCAALQMKKWQCLKQAENLWENLHNAELDQEGQRSKGSHQIKP